MKQITPTEPTVKLGETGEQPSLRFAPARISRAAAGVMHRTRSKVALTLYAAALIHQLPTWNPVEEINVVYFHQRTFSKTVVDKDHHGNGITVRRHFRDFPPWAVKQHDKQPVLKLEWLILEYLALKDPFQALVTADAALRRLVNARRENPEEQQILTAQWKEYLGYITRTYVSEYYQARILRRIRLLDPLAESPLESVVAVAMQQLRRTTYRTQQPLKIKENTFFADGFLPAEKTVVEADGRFKERLDPCLVALRIRENRIRRAGFQVVRFNTGECWHPRLAHLICAKLGWRPPRYLRKV